MSQNSCSMLGLVRPATMLSLLLVVLHSHQTCQSFQPSPLPLKSQASGYFSNNKKYTAHRRFYTDPTSSNVHDQTPPPPSFEERMRMQLKRHREESSSDQAKGHGASQLVPNVRDLQDFKAALDKAGDEKKMMAVLWYSPWCKACKSVLPGIRALAKRHSNVQFIQVPVTAENSNLHQGLDVPSVPFLHLYTPDDPRLVEERKMTRPRLSGFQKLLTDYEKGSCSLENSDGLWSISSPYELPPRDTAEDEGVGGTTLP